MTWIPSPLEYYTWTVPKWINKLMSLRSAWVSNNCYIASMARSSIRCSKRLLGAQLADCYLNTAKKGLIRQLHLSHELQLFTGWYNSGALRNGSVKDAYNGSIQKFNLVLQQWEQFRTMSLSLSAWLSAANWCVDHTGGR